MAVGRGRSRRGICSYLYSVKDIKKANLITLAEPLIFTPLIYLIMCLILKLDGLWLAFTVIQFILVGFGSLLLYKSIKKDKNKVFS